MIVLAALMAPPTAWEAQNLKAATAVIEQYYGALAHNDYRVAHALWPTGPTAVALRRSYVPTLGTKVTLLYPSGVKGAAGSIYAEIYVQIDAQLVTGSRQRFRGLYRLRRVNDVDGSSMAQRQWHITEGNVSQVPADD